VQARAVHIDPGMPVVAPPDVMRVGEFHLLAGRLPPGVEVWRYFTADEGDMSTPPRALAYRHAGAAQVPAHVIDDALVTQDKGVPRVEVARPLTGVEEDRAARSVAIEFGVHGVLRRKRRPRTPAGSEAHLDAGADAVEKHVGRLRRVV